MNRVTLLGRVGSDPEVKTFDWGKVAKFSLATSETRKKNNEKVTETTWHNIVFFGASCDVLEKYVHKGDQILVEGKIVVRSYEKQGTTHWATEIVCDSFEFCGSPKGDKEPPRAKDEWKGKKEVKSMSDINDLPGHVQEQQDQLSDLPF